MKRSREDEEEITPPVARLPCVVALRDSLEKARALADLRRAAKDAKDAELNSKVAALNGKSKVLTTTLCMLESRKRFLLQLSPDRRRGPPPALEAVLHSINRYLQRGEDVDLIVALGLSTDSREPTTELPEGAAWCSLYAIGEAFKATLESDLQQKDVGDSINTLSGWRTLRRGDSSGGKLSIGQSPKLKEYLIEHVILQVLSGNPGLMKDTRWRKRMGLSLVTEFLGQRREDLDAALRGGVDESSCLAAVATWLKGGDGSITDLSDV